MLLDLDEFIGKVSSLQNADKTRNVVVAVFLVAESVEHNEPNGVDVTYFTVGQQAAHFLQHDMHERVTLYTQPYDGIVVSVSDS